MGSRLSFSAVSAAILLTVLLSSPLAISAQSHRIPRPEAQQSGDQGSQVPHDLEDRMAKERLKSRYQDLKRDSEKLLELATELKQYVDKSGEQTLSLEVIHKCDEIEKLSKSVRSKMKGD